MSEAVALHEQACEAGDRGAGRLRSKAGIQLFSASLPEGAPLAATGWALTPDREDPAKVAVLAGQEASRAVGLEGGTALSVLRQRLASGAQRVGRADLLRRGADNLWGPYTIGYLEWDGGRWVEQAAPVFLADEEWEHGSVYEPNLIYADGAPVPQEGAQPLPVRLHARLPGEGAAVRWDLMHPRRGREPGRAWNAWSRMPLWLLPRSRPRRISSA